LPSRLTAFIAEANRRRVFRTAGVYLVGVWAISQGLVELAPLFGAPVWLLRALLVGAVAFAPVVVILAWMFDIGRTGIVRDAQDVHVEGPTDQISNMQTQLGLQSGLGAVKVGWKDRSGDQSVLFVDAFHIGRANDCRVRFYDPLVSRKHVRVFPQDGAWRLQDLGSRNGTTVDANRVDSIELGKTSEIRVNEAGPVLKLELIAPGEDTTVALSKAERGVSIAHVRSDAMDVQRPNQRPGGPATLES